MPLEDILAAVEQLTEKTSAALLATDAQALEKYSTHLRNAAAALAQAVEQAQAAGTLPDTLKPRLQAVQATLSMQRDNLARVSALTQRQMATVLPASTDGAGTYGDGGRPAAGSSGAARVYRSAG